MPTVELTAPPEGLFEDPVPVVKPSRKISQEVDKKH
jgi:hypothetical protein